MDSARSGKILLDSSAMAKCVEKIADAICAEFRGCCTPDLAFIGIQKHGVVLAKRIAAVIKEKTGGEPPVGTLDISMYRDDIGMRKSLPLIHPTLIPFDIDKRVVILADDVLQSGRTIRAALDAMTDYGRPRLIRLAVLVDRGMREFPIQADYAGAVLDVPQDIRVSVKWIENDGEDVVCETEKTNTTSSGALK